MWKGEEKEGGKGHEEKGDEGKERGEGGGGRQGNKLQFIVSNYSASLPSA